MKKQRLLLTALAALASFNAAANTYVGATLSVQDMNAYPSHFRGLRPGLFFGYGMMLDRDYYLGGELMGTAASTLNDNYVNRNDSVRMSPDFNVSLLPGMMIAPATMAFLRVGYSVGQFTTNNGWRSGLLLGLGMEAAISPCWSVRGEYDYTVFGSMSAGTPKSDEAAVSLKYTFDV